MGTQSDSELWKPESQAELSSITKLVRKDFEELENAHVSNEIDLNSILRSCKSDSFHGYQAPKRSKDHAFCDALKG